jgi:hypothetical protein
MRPSFAAIAAIAATATLVLTGCGGAQSNQTTGPGPAAADSGAPARVVALFENLAADLQAADADCDRIATVLTTWTDDHRKDYPDLVRQAQTGELPAEQGQSYRERLHAALDVVVGTATRCGEHPGAQAAFTRFDVLVDPQQ